MVDVTGGGEDDSAHGGMIDASLAAEGLYTSPRRVPVEHEMKIPVANLAAVRARLAKLGAVPLHPPTLEQNWVLDDETGSRVAAGQLVRVRRYGATSTLTFKGAATFAAGVKSRRELETRVGDAAELLVVLAALGLEPRRRYEKRREEWRSGAVTVALDETPMGSFVELEGPPGDLRPLAVRLALEPDAAVTGNYLELWEAFRTAHPEAGEDMLLP
jgi:adenylate cyclase class 2